MNILGALSRLSRGCGSCSVDNPTGGFSVDHNSEYKRMMKKSTRTQSGLYPPEVVMIYFCKNTNKYPSSKSDSEYPVYWLREYGIDDVDSILLSLREKGYIKLNNNGYYKPTELGLNEVEQNEHIIWAHKTHLFGGAWNIEKEMQRVPPRMSNWSWQDKVWWLFHDEQLRLIKKIAKLGSSARLTGECGDYRNSVLFQAQFLEYEKRYEDAANLYERVLEIDKELDGDAYRPAPGVVESINKCRKRAKK